jgi:dipeptidase D
MSSVLSGLEPKVVWKHFDALSKIPRASSNEAAARQYVLDLAHKLQLETQQDEAGNVVVRKPPRPGREQAPMALLQGHLDMVCEKNEGTAHDFSKDAIRVVRDGDWLKADGTTLGADNGVGVAASLAVMESTEIAHGPLEFVYTMDEETGLTGASKFGKGMLKAKYFLNLDNEEKGTLCIGCSGGVNTTARRKVVLQPAGSGAAFRVKVSGLKGGHSGVDIHQGRGNALRILGNALQRVLEKVPVRIADIKGGSARNVIPREAAAIVVLDPAHEKELRPVLSDFANETRADLGGFDPGVQITVEPADRPSQILDSADAKQIVDLLATVPHGVLAMSPDIPGLTQTSTNLATIAIKGDQVEFGTSQRSAIEASKQAARRMVETVFRIAEFDIEHDAGYPGWKPEPNSDIVRTCKSVYEQTFGEQPRLIAMHAGLECGVIGEKYPGMQMISFGPQIESPHSPNERVEIPSVADFWKYLRAVLERLQ